MDCFRQIDKQTCDSHIEEECEYSGELLRRFDKGYVVSHRRCQRLCENSYPPNCKYWIFHDREAECILKRDGRKTCTVRGGPKEPSYDHCKNKMSTMSSHAL